MRARNQPKRQASNITSSEIRSQSNFFHSMNLFLEYWSRYFACHTQVSYLTNLSVMHNFNKKNSRASVLLTTACINVRVYQFESINSTALDLEPLNCVYVSNVVGPWLMSTELQGVDKRGADSRLEIHKEREREYRV